jgi:preprotein translocase subunit YajC
MQGSGDIFVSLLPLVVLFAIFYFIVIRPQSVEAKKHKEMVEGLAKGDKIITTGGLYAEVVKSEEDFIKVKLNDEVIVKLARDYVARKLETTEVA